jgi:ATP-dependent RNA helicase DDX42
VYATAAALDASLEYDMNDQPVNMPKREIEPLARVDHSTIEYASIEKNFYQEHPDIAALDNDRVQSIRKELGVHVTGQGVAKPCISFAHFGFDQDLMDAIIKANYTEPSAIQKQAIPVALGGRDIIGIAKTGSGKTAAFVLPMLIHMMDQPELVKGDGPIGLILAPTRELAVQIYQESRKFAKAYGLK